MTDEEFRLDVVVRDGHQWVVVHGELDLATAPVLDAALAERLSAASGPPVVIDLTRCGFIDSSGVRSLVRFGDQARTDGRPLALVCTPDSAARFTLDLLGVAEVIPVHDTVEDVTRGDGRASSA